MTLDEKDASLRGLTDQEVAERVADGRTNANTDVKTKTVGQILAEHAFTLFNGVNLALALLVLLTGQYRNMLFMCVVGANLVIGVTQEIRAKRMVAGAERRLPRFSGRARHRAHRGSRGISLDPFWCMGARCGGLACPILEKAGPITEN